MVNFSIFFETERKKRKMEKRKQFKTKQLKDDLIALLSTMLLQVIVFYTSTCITASTVGLDTSTLVSILGLISYAPSNWRFNKTKPQSKTKASGIVLLLQYVLLATQILLMLVTTHCDPYNSCLKLLLQVISTLDKMYCYMSTSLITNKKRKRLRKKLRNRN